MENPQKLDNRTDTPGVTILPPVGFLALFGLGAGIEALFPLALPFYINEWLGLCLMIMGLIIGFLPVFKFVAIGNDLRPNKPSNHFIAQGLFRFTRNPMYLGAVIGFLGISILFQSLWLLVSSLLIMLYLESYVIPREEAYMARTYGKTYRDYCIKVRRWL